MIVGGSFHGTRTTGTVSVCEMACSIGHTSFMSVSPCCMSTTSASKPWRAMTSAVNPWDTESHPIVTHFPSLHICFILFGRTVVPLCDWWLGRLPPPRCARDHSENFAAPPRPPGTAREGVPGGDGGAYVLTRCA